MKKGCFVISAIFMVVFFASVYYLVLNKNTLIVKYAFSFFEENIKNDLNNHVYTKIKDENLKLQMDNAIKKVFENIKLQKYDDKQIKLLVSIYDNFVSKKVIYETDLKQLLELANQKDSIYERK